MKLSSCSGKVYGFPYEDGRVDVKLEDGFDR